VNGAQALIRTLVGSGIDVCFANPGTSEMHFVAALDDVPELRAVLCLFEGVATGAADGFARMSGRPAATLLHLGPGLGNGLANLHNARRASSPVLNIVGDHATWHTTYDSPLTSDIQTVADNVSPGFVRRCQQVESIGLDAVAAIDAALGPPGSVATLVLPADVSWGEGGRLGPATAGRQPSLVAAEHIESIAATLKRSDHPALLVGGSACSLEALEVGAAVAAATGSRVISETFPPRLARGVGIPMTERLAYLSEYAVKQLDGITDLVLVDAEPPVAFFAYPDQASYLVPDDCRVHELASGSHDVLRALDDLAAELAADGESVRRRKASAPDPPEGALTAESVMQAVGALLPDSAVISDESVTAGQYAFHHTRGSAPHDYLTLTGGAIGQGLPVALGAAMACRGRRVISLEADGSAMYTPQAWWTMAREGLDVTTILLNNSAYAVLRMELSRVGAGTGGERARQLLDIGYPDLDFVSIASGMGVESRSADTADEFVRHLRWSLATPGPTLVEARIPPLA
jgi:acetolactate synthase-1/2/3 large subunit